METEIRNDVGLYADYFATYFKTDRLCHELARAGVPWTNDDLERARKETGTLEFNENDILLLRKMMTDEEFSGLERAFDVHLQNMRRIPANERIGYWKKWAAPISERKNEIARQYRLQTEGLQLYRDLDQEELNEEVVKFSLHFR